MEVLYVFELSEVLISHPDTVISALDAQKLHP